MSVRIHIKDAVKQYGDQTVIPNLTLDVHQGELFTLLGPSGCGKTTLLRMIAGFNTIEAGDIHFNAQRMNELPPHKRNIGMVFQDYAIFPHMTTGENVAFGLKNRRLKEPYISKQVDDILSVVKIHHLKDRLPSEMSGGQQQRLALARAIVVQPDVLLMDEPLSNLDAKLRVEMRNAIKDIQKRFKITTIYVTHDQEEALAISDRIAIMNEGVIQQVGTPFEIYQYPANRFVAQFIGKSVFLSGVITKDGNQTAIRLNGGKSYVLPGLDQLRHQHAVTLLVRPHELIFTNQGEGGMSGTVEAFYFLGTHVQYMVRLENGDLIEVVDHQLDRSPKEKGSKVTLDIQAPVFNIYDQQSGQSLYNRPLELGEGKTTNA